MNLATCEEKLNKLASAWQHWKEAVDALPPGDDRIAFARSRVVDLEKKLPRLTVTLANGTEAGAKFFATRSSSDRSAQGIPLPVNPGPHTVTVKMSGHLPQRRSQSQSARGNRSRSRCMPAHSTRMPTKPPRASSSSRALELRAGIVGAVGVAGVGTGIATGLMLVSKRSAAESACPTEVCSSQVDVDAASSGKTLLVANTVSWIVGGVGLGLGAYLVLSAPRHRTTAILVPSASPDGASLSCVGRF